MASDVQLAYRASAQGASSPRSWSQSAKLAGPCGQGDGGTAVDPDPQGGGAVALGLNLLKFRARSSIEILDAIPGNIDDRPNASSGEEGIGVQGVDGERHCAGNTASIAYQARTMPGYGVYQIGERVHFRRGLQQGPADLLARISGSPERSTRRPAVSRSGDGIDLRSLPEGIALAIHHDGELRCVDASGGIDRKEQLPAYLSGSCCGLGGQQAKGCQAKLSWLQAPVQAGGVVGLSYALLTGFTCGPADLGQTNADVITSKRTPGPDP